MTIKRAILFMLAVLLLPGLAWAQAEPTDTRVTFFVAKVYSDGNIAPVDVTLSCNTGLPLEQTKNIEPLNAGLDYVDFVVVDFDSGELNCEVTEEVPSGYSPLYIYGLTTTGLPTSQAEAQAGQEFEVSEEACFFEGVPDESQFEGELFCLIINIPDPVPVVINKDWIIEGSVDENGVSQQFNITLTCESEIIGGYQVNGDWRVHAADEGDATFSFLVIPDFPSTTCEVDESVFDSAVESDNGCGQFEVSVNNGHECTITNTVFFEGIPTLNPYGLALLALLMLGVGFVGFRRFV
jgi:hypothetical protein